MVDLVGAYFRGRQLREASDAADQARRDTAERRAATADVAPVIKEAADGMGPSAVMVGKNAYGTEKEAGDAAAAYNAPDAKIARLQGVMLNQADPAGAMGLEKAALDMKAVRQRAAKVVEDEGINSFIDTNLGAAPSVADIEGGKAGMFDLQGSDAYNAVGKSKIPDGAKGRWKVMDYGNGRKEADFEVLGADGRPIAPSARTLQAIHGMALHEREQLADKRAADAAAQRDKAADNARAERELTGRLTYLKKIGDAAGERADKYMSGGIGGSGRGGGSPFERMNQYDLEAYKSAVGRTKMIDEGIIKATMEGTWDPAKNPAQQLLLLQKAQQERAADVIMGRYSGSPASGGQGKPDPYGIRGMDAAAPPPTSQAARGVMLAEPPKVTTQKLNELAAAAGIARIPGPRGADRYVRKIGDGRRQVEMSRDELAQFLKVPY
ncbi:MAG: hypothetical protein RI907_993 [Pseudomonadota bacterium]|jgi:hypothetical protein